MAKLIIVILIYTILLSLSIATSPKKILLTPQFGFVIGFIPGLLYACFYVDKWMLDLSNETMIVLIGGATSFFIFSLFFQTIKKHTNIRFLRKAVNNGSVNSEIIIENTKIYTIMIINCITLLWTLFFLINKFGTNLSAAIYSYRVSYLLGEDAANFGTILANLRFISFASALIWAYLIVHSLVYNYKKNRRLYVINYIICIVTDLLSGARGDTLLLIFSTFVMMYMLYKAKNNWSVSIKPKTIIKISILFLGMLFLYQLLGNVLGRGEDGSNFDFIAKYLAAEIKNLDTFIRYGQKGSEISDWLSLRILLLKISEFTGNNIVSLDRYYFGGVNGFASVNGFNLGNVYTAYFSYVHDLGMLGAFVFPGLMAITAQFFFGNAIKQSRKINKINMNIILYSFIYFPILFSFFSERFFDYVYNFAFLKRVIIIYGIILFFEKIKITKRG